MFFILFLVLCAVLLSAFYWRYLKSGKFVHHHHFNIAESEIYPAYGEETSTEVFTCEPSKCLPIRYAKTGTASYHAKTIFDIFDAVCINCMHETILTKEYPECRNDPKSPLKWRSFTTKETFDNIQTIARAFISLELDCWQSICIIGFNSPEWMFFYFGAIYAGGLACGIYPSNNTAQYTYIMTHSKCKIAVVENNRYLFKILQAKQLPPLLTTIVVWTAMETSDIEIPIDFDLQNIRILSYSALLKLGNDDISLDEEMHHRMNNIQPGSACSLIYTSGTTGVPKGVMLSHDNLLWNAYSILASHSDIDWFSTHSYVHHTLVSYLPLSHIAAQVLDFFGPLVIVANGGHGTIYFARNDALKGSKSLLTTLLTARPTIFLGVPRVWEKMQEKLLRVGKKSSFIIRYISAYAKKIGLEASLNRQIDGNMHMPFAYKFIKATIFRLIHQKMGFDRLQLALSGAAPISKSTLMYFASLDIQIIEAYGMSECSAVQCMGKNYFNLIGSVGHSINGSQLIIDEQTGEICIRGRNRMLGYIYDVPLTKKCIDHRGFLHSGDIGHISDGNILYITGRIKEIIITAGGENIAPVPIENYLKGKLLAVSNLVVVGEQRKYLTCLVTLKCRELKGCAVDDMGNEFEGIRFSDRLADDALMVDEECKVVGDCRRSEVWKKYIDDGIQEYNDEFCVSRAQRIQYFCILDGNFSEDGGELTSTLKLKRSVVYEKYIKEIESMY